MKYELIIVWYTGEKNKYLYDTQGEAKAAKNNFKMAFGNQIIFTGINETRK